MKTLTWDVDDVLNDLMKEWFHQAWLPGHPECKVTYPEIRENPPQKILSVPLEIYLNSLDAFRTKHGPSLQPDATVLAWFREHGHRFRHRVLTAVPLHLADISAAWVMKHFGNWIRSFNVVPSPRPGTTYPDYDRTKAEALHWLGASDLMIDDNVSTIAELRQRSVPTLLWPRPWNDNPATPAQALAALASL